MIFEAKDMVCGYDGIPIVKNVSLKVESGEIYCLLGPNGVGKTTLFKSMLGFLKLMGGNITLDGEDVLRWPARRRAQVVGYVPQTHTPPFPYKVLDVVVMGRVAHLGSFASPGEEDIHAAEEALDRLEMSYLANKIYTEISGGERQMVLVARALAQDPQILVMDEPTSNLDFGNQVRVLSQVNRLAEDGIGVLMTTHFPDHAFLCSSTVGLLMKDGFLNGPADRIVTEENLRAAYGVDVRIIDEYEDGVGLLKSCVPVMKNGREHENEQRETARIVCAGSDFTEVVPSVDSRQAMTL